MDNFEFLTYLDGVSIEQFFTTIRTSAHIDQICQTIANIGGFCCLILGIVQLARHFMAKRPAPPLMLVMTYFTLAVGGVLIARDSWSNDDVLGMTGWATMVKNTVKNMANNGGGSGAGAESPGWWSAPSGSTGYWTPDNTNGWTDNGAHTPANWTSDNTMGWTPSQSTPANWTPDNTMGWTNNPSTTYQDVSSVAKDYIRNRLAGDESFRTFYSDAYDNALADQLDALYQAYITNPATAFDYMTKDEFKQKILSEEFANKAGAVQNRVLQELLAQTDDAYKAAFTAAGGDALVALGEDGRDAIYNAYKSEAEGKVTNDMWNTEANLRDAYQKARADSLNDAVNASANAATIGTRTVEKEQYVRDSSGNIVYETTYARDADGNIKQRDVYAKNDDGSTKYEQAKDADGNPRTDAAGNPIYDYSKPIIVGQEPIVTGRAPKTEKVSVEVVDSITYTIDGETVTKHISGEYANDAAFKSSLADMIRGDVEYSYNQQTYANLNDNTYMSDSSVNTTQYARAEAVKDIAMNLYSEDLSEARATAQTAKDAAVREAYAKANEATIDTLKNSSDPADQALYQSIMNDVNARVNDPSAGYDASKQKAEAQYEADAKRAVQTQAQANATAQANTALANQLDQAVNYIYNQDSMMNGQGSLSSYLNSAQDQNKGTIDQMLNEWANQTRNEWGNLT